MKNYIANTSGNWDTSAGYVIDSISRCIHYGRLYTSGRGRSRGREADLCEALRCLGQALHTLEDFSAHSNYCELALRELGFDNVFPHTGVDSAIELQGRRVYPIVTGTFGMVDFLHSVIGEATDHFTQSDLADLDNAMAADSGNRTADGAFADLLGKMPGSNDLVTEARALQTDSDEQEAINRERGWQPSTAPGFEQTGSRELGAGGSHDDGNDRGLGAASEYYGADQPAWQPQQQPAQPQPAAYHDPGYQAASAASSWQPPQGSNAPGYPQNFAPTWQSPAQGGAFQGEYSPHPAHSSQPDYSQPGYSQSGNPPQSGYSHTENSPNQSQSPEPHGQPGPGLPGMPDFDPEKTIAKIYPILRFRDKVVRRVSDIIEHIPGLDALVEKVSDLLQVFIFSLLAPFLRPVLKIATSQLLKGSTTVVDASGRAQFEPWTDPHCTDPTHSLLSKDHFTNILNEPAGHVAAAVLRFVVPRVLYAWQHVDVPVERVTADCVSVFHHPAVRDRNNELHVTMFREMDDWVQAKPGRKHKLNERLSSQSVKEGKNLKSGSYHGHGHGHGHSPSQSHTRPNSSGLQNPSPPPGGPAGLGSLASSLLGGGGSSNSHGTLAENIGSLLTGGSHGGGSSGGGGSGNLVSSLLNSGSHGGGSSSSSSGNLVGNIANSLLSSSSHDGGGSSSIPWSNIGSLLGKRDIPAEGAAVGESSRVSQSKPRQRRPSPRDEHGDDTSVQPTQEALRHLTLTPPSGYEAYSKNPTGFYEPPFESDKPSAAASSASLASGRSHSQCDYDNWMRGDMEQRERTSQKYSNMDRPSRPYGDTGSYGVPYAGAYMAPPYEDRVRDEYERETDEAYARAPRATGRYGYGFDYGDYGQPQGYSYGHSGGWESAQGGGYGGLSSGFEQKYGWGGGMGYYE